MRKSIFLILIAAVFLTSGCRTLSQKFVRKKTYKKEKEVFVKPRDYPLGDSKELYIDYYTYARGWMGELIDALFYKEGEKEVIVSCQRILENITHLREFFTGEPELQERLDFYIEEYQGILTRFENRGVDAFYWEKYLYKAQKLEKDFEKEFKVSRIFE